MHPNAANNNFFSLLFIIFICMTSTLMVSSPNVKIIDRIHSILHRKIIKFHEMKNLKASSSTETDDINSESSSVDPSVAKTETSLGYKSNFISNNRKSLFNELDDDAIIKIFEYLDEQNFSDICLVSKACLALANQFFSYTLSKFNPYFTFNERWMSRVMLKFLNSYFDKLQSEFTCDNLEYANYNFALEYTNNTNSTLMIMSFSIKYLIFAFINEIYYGTDKFSLTCLLAWKHFFIRKFMENEHNMRKCLNLYSGIVLGSRNEHFKTKLDDLFKFIKTKPDYSSLLNYYRKYIQLNNNEFNFYAPEINLVLRSILHKDLVFGYDFRFFNSIYCNFLHSRYVNSRYNFSEISEDIKSKLLKTLEIENINIETVRAIYNVVGSDKDEDYLRYIWTRNALNHFNLDKFLSLKTVNIRKVITDLASVTDPSLVQIEIFKQLIRYINNNVDSADNFQVIRRSNDDSLISSICKSSTLIFAIFIKEVSFPINMFELNRDSYDYKCSFDFRFNFNNQALNQRDKLEIFIMKLRQSTNIPLPLLFVNFELLMNPKIRHLITNYFDLDRKYIFDANFDDLIIEGISKYKLAQQKGKSLNFRELIGLFGNLSVTQKRDIISILSSKPKKNNKSSILEWIENVTKVESRKPISIFKFIFYGIFEEVDGNISDHKIQTNTNVMTYLK